MEGGEDLYRLGGYEGVGLCSADEQGRGYATGRWDVRGDGRGGHPGGRAGYDRARS